MRQAPASTRKVGYLDSIHNDEPRRWPCFDGIKGSKWLVDTQYSWQHIDLLSLEEEFVRNRYHRRS